MRRFAVPVLFAAVLLSGCEMLGIESPEKLAAAREADGRAVGAACRHAGRALEDCYALNRRADKAAIFAGWLEMNDYMRENKIEPVAPVLVAQAAATKGAGDAKADRDASSAKDGADPAKPEAKDRKGSGT
ncbi:hypothetical protein [Piscinibacter sp.]|uniref:hypothetical protein n=1 Tax=Piscinibacter sp. TaxID=1903157 RepID=UPI002D7FF167|nr:hypothetical protein [Albitalea sp.]